MSIYRKEALEYQRVRLSGTVSLMADRKTAQLALVFLFIFSLAACAFFWTEVNVSAPLQCSVQSASRIQFKASPALGAKGRLESVQIVVGNHTTTFTPVQAAMGQPMYADVNVDQVAGPAREQHCRATGRFALSPGQLILTKLFRKS